MYILKYIKLNIFSLIMNYNWYLTDIKIIFLIFFYFYLLNISNLNFFLI